MIAAFSYMPDGLPMLIRPSISASFFRRSSANSKVMDDPGSSILGRIKWEHDHHVLPGKHHGTFREDFRAPYPLKRWLSTGTIVPPDQKPSDMSLLSIIPPSVNLRDKAM